MKHFIPFAILLFAPLAHAQQLELPKEVRVPFAHGRLVTIEGKTDAERITWDVLHAPGVEIEAVTGAKRISMGMPSAGTKFYVIGAVSGPNGAVLARCYVEVTGAAPKQETEPPARSGIVKHATLLVKAKSTVNSLIDPLRTQLERRSIRLHVLAVSEADEAFAGLHQQVGGDCMVLQDQEGNVVPEGNVFRLNLTGDSERDAGDLVGTVDQSNQ